MDDVNSPRRTRWSTWGRRKIFVLALLGTGSIVAVLTGAYSYDRGHPFSLVDGNYWSWLSFMSIYRRSTGLSGLWIAYLFPNNAAAYFDALLWGADFALVIVLGAWLFFRDGWWQTCGGRLRAIIYLIAFNYGSMLTTTTQRWLNDLTPNGYTRYANGPNGLYVNYKSAFHFPGTQINAYYNDYSRPATDLLLLLVALWLLFPSVAICPRRLGHPKTESRPSVSTILTWTTLSAATLAYTRFLCWWASPDTGYSSMPLSNAVAECVFQLLPASIIPVLAVLIIANNSKIPNWLLVLIVVALLIFDTVAYQLLFSHFGDFSGRENPLSTSERWAFQLGRFATIWAAFALAARLGVSFNRVPHQARTKQRIAVPVA